MSTHAGRLAPLVRSVPDWPRPGVAFCDLTPLFADAAAFHEAVTAIADHFSHGIADAGGGPVTKVAAVEARGFIVGAPVALRIDAGLVPVRRAGRLPAAVEATEYTLDYGTELLEILNDAVESGDRVLVVDDVLGTGATAEAVVRIVERLGGHVVGVAAVVELSALGGRERLGSTTVFSVLELDAPDLVASRVSGPGSG
jgi:adenine phosphoribosyltransferase